MCPPSRARRQTIEIKLRATKFEKNELYAAIVRKHEELEDSDNAEDHHATIELLKNIAEQLR